MDFLKDVLQLVLLLLLNCNLGECYRIICKGDLTVDQSTISIGDNLTIHCQSNTDQCNRPFIIKLDGKEVWRETSCSRVTAQIVMWQQKSFLHCLVHQGGVDHFVCGRDIVANQIPSTPQIKGIVFEVHSMSPTIYWQNLDDAEFLKPNLMFRRTYPRTVWMEGNVTQLHGGKLVLLEDLEPLTPYQFKLRVCTVSLRSNCSLWSQLVNQSSPGKAPVRKLDVWRVITRSSNSTTQNVTIMWKALSTKDYKGNLLHYQLVYQENGTTHTLISSAAVTEYTLELPLEVTELTITAITSAGNSPPASVNLTQAGTNSTQYDTSLYVESTDGALKSAFGQIQTPSPKIKKDTWANPAIGVEPVLQTAAERPEGKMIFVLCLITAVPIVIFVNLIYLKCTRQRIRKMCVSMGPSWLFGTLPKLSNSNAIKLLKDERYGSDLYWQPVDSDPPLSPVEDLSPIVERKHSYPTVHKEDITEETEVANWKVCHYKPQISNVSQRADAMNDAIEEDEDEHPWVIFTSPAFKFEEESHPNQGIHASHNICLTLDGRPIFLDVIDGFLFCNQTVLD